VTFLTKPDDPDKLLAFYRKVRPGGFWGPIARLNGRAYKLQAAPFAGWALAVLMILFLLLGLGRVIFLGFAAGAAYLAAGALAAVILSKVIARIDF
jgi:SSS family solute:Na+ symporter